MCGTMLAIAMQSVHSVIAARELLWNLTLRELRTKYRKSFLGWAWSMLNPLATVAIYTFVFGVLFEANAPNGDPSGLRGFAYFLLAALLPWNFFSLVANLGLTSISGNSGLVRRVAFPREVLVFSNSLHACVQFAIELGIFAVVLLLVGGPVFPWILGALVTSLFLALFGTGVALALSVLAVYFKDVTYLWAIFLQVWFFLTPIVYAPEVVDEKAPAWVTSILDFNPMRAFAIAYRSFLYDGRFPPGETIVFIVIVSMLSLIAGWKIFGKLGRRLAEEV